MNEDFSGGENSPVDLLEETEALYREMAEELARALKGARRGEAKDAKAAVQAVKDMRSAFQLLMEERTRVEKLRKQIAGAVRGRELDFDAARVEIGRRLARLRDAGDG